MDHQHDCYMLKSKLHVQRLATGVDLQYATYW